MTQVSKYKVPQIINDQILDIFFQTIANLKTKEQVAEFFKEFISPTEKTMLSKRLAIGYLIAKGCDYREVSRTLKVSTTTVSNFASKYKYGTTYKIIVDNIMTKIKTKELFLDIVEGFAEIGAIGGAKSAGYFQLRNEIRKKKNNLL